MAQAIARLSVVGENFMLSLPSVLIVFYV